MDGGIDGWMDGIPFHPKESPPEIPSTRGVRSSPFLTSGSKGFTEDSLPGVPSPEIPQGPLLDINGVIPFLP